MLCDSTEKRDTRGTGEWSGTTVTLKALWHKASPALVHMLQADEHNLAANSRLKRQPLYKYTNAQILVHQLSTKIGFCAYVIHCNRDITEVGTHEAMAYCGLQYETSGTKKNRKYVIFHTSMSPSALKKQLYYDTTFINKHYNTNGHSGISVLPTDGNKKK